MAKMITNNEVMSRLLRDKKTRLEIVERKINDLQTERKHLIETIKFYPILLDDLAKLQKGDSPE
jgi:hypothetical protein